MRRDSVARHYLGLAQGMCARTMADPERTKLKALFYVLRPLFALRWLRAHADQSIAPMNFQALMSGIEIEAAVRDEIAALLAVKAVTHELGTGPVPPAIRAFIEGEFAIAAEALPSQRPLAPDAVLQADAFYRWAIDRYGGPA
jgi:predicted nucleotidyltransferase